MIGVLGTKLLTAVSVYHCLHQRFPRCVTDCDDVCL